MCVDHLVFLGENEWEGTLAIAPYVIKRKRLALAGRKDPECFYRALGTCRGVCLPSVSSLAHNPYETSLSLFLSLAPCLSALSVLFIAPFFFSLVSRLLCFFVLFFALLFFYFHHFRFFVFFFFSRLVYFSIFLSYFKRSPGTPARSSKSKSAFLSGADTLEKDPGPLDLLHIAVQDVTAAADASGRDSGALSTFRYDTVYVLEKIWKHLRRKVENFLKTHVRRLGGILRINIWKNKQTEVVRSKFSSKLSCVRFWCDTLMAFFTECVGRVYMIYHLHTNMHFVCILGTGLRVIHARYVSGIYRITLG